MNEADKQRMESISGPFIVWEDYGCEGWQPKSYATLLEAVNAHSYQPTTIVTRTVKYEVTEVQPL